MTIHQAKNREFGSVIVLWPYEVAGSGERRRRSQRTDRSPGGPGDGWRPPGRDLEGEAGR